MKTRFTTCLLALCASLSLLFSCGIETPEKPEPEVRTIPYRALVKSAQTKATLNSSTQYVFEAGDRLYVCHTANDVVKMYGVLTLISGAGSTTAEFQGDLACVDDFTPASDTPVNVTLLGASDEYHQVSTDYKTLTANDLTGKFASSFVEAVQRFSHFTDNAHSFGDASFSLSQQNSFIRFSLTLKKDDFPAVVIVKLNNGGNEIRSVSITPASMNEDAVRADFTLPFAGGTELHGTTSLTVQNGEDSPVSLTAIETADDFTLAANTYYNIKRTAFSWDGFAIKATEDNTIVTVNYYSGISGDRDVTTIEYSLDEGGSWTEYTAVSAITLNAGDRLCLRGKATKYNGYNSPFQLFSANKLCSISGDMMSLMCNASWERSSSAGVDAFNSFFKSATWIDINQDKPLILSATSLGNKCYKNMFAGCTNLTTAPILPASTPGTGKGDQGSFCQMFDGCSKLVYVKCLVTTNVGGSNTATKNWMRGVFSSGIFVTTDSSIWSRDEHGIPSGWTPQEPE